MTGFNVFIFFWDFHRKIKPKQSTVPCTILKLNLYLLWSKWTCYCSFFVKIKRIPNPCALEKSNTTVLRVWAAFVQMIVASLKQLDYDASHLNPRDVRKLLKLLRCTSLLTLAVQQVHNSPFRTYFVWDVKTWSTICQWRFSFIWSTVFQDRWRFFLVQKDSRMFSIELDFGLLRLNWSNWIPGGWSIQFFGTLGLTPSAPAALLLFEFV